MTRLALRGVLLTALAGAGWTVFAACGGGDSTTNPADAGPSLDQASPLDAPVDTLVADSSAPDSADAADATPPPCTSTCGTPNCGTCPGTATVSQMNPYTGVTFKIDTLEVTNADYATFLAANVDPKTQPAFCTSNASFVPSVGWPATDVARPVEYVDWCDAHAFCSWAGKRLCGLIADGGVVASVYEDNGDQSEWFSACTGHMGGTGPGGWRAYPYGDTYMPTACNGADYGATKTIDAGSATGCVGGIAKLYDMSGNVAEWENNCSGGDGGPGNCDTRGGSFASDAGALECAITANVAGGQGSAGLGFRCCTN